MRIQHNIAALNSYRNLRTNNSGIAKNLEKLSSGYRINRAGDDAACLAISEKMRSQITGINRAIKNAQDGISLVQTAEGALTEVHSMLNRMVELADQSANGIYEDRDRSQLQEELKALNDEIDRISASTQFAGRKLLNGDASSQPIVNQISNFNVKRMMTANAISRTAEITNVMEQNFPSDFSQPLGSGIYTISGTQVVNQRITIADGAKVVFRLADDADLTVNGGIECKEGQSFTLDGAETGKLHIQANNDNKICGIGCSQDDGGNSGEITIASGIISVEGFNVGIGSNTGNANVNIRGGVVDSITGSEVGIGSIGGSADISIVNGTIKNINATKCAIGSAGGDKGVAKIFIRKSTVTDLSSASEFATIGDKNNNGEIKIEASIINNIKNSGTTASNAAIGGNNIIIKNSKVTNIQGGSKSAGIGTGANANKVVKININNSIISVSAGETTDGNLGTSKAQAIGKGENGTGTTEILRSNSIISEDGGNSFNVKGEHKYKPDEVYNGKEIVVGEDSKLTFDDVNDYNGAKDKIKNNGTINFGPGVSEEDVKNLGDIGNITIDGKPISGTTPINPDDTTPTPGGNSDSINEGGIILQVGDTRDQIITIDIQEMNSKKLGTKDLDISTEEGARHALEVLIGTDTNPIGAINTVSQVRGQLGAVQNRLEHTINNLSVNAENMTAAESRIRDVDMAKEMMIYTKNNILVQAAQSMLAQANQVPQGILQLLK